jgi:hypothetical protein
MTDTENRVCQWAHPVMRCNLPESWALGSIHVLGVIGCLYLLFQHRKKTKTTITTPSPTDFNIFFWISLIVWLISHSVITIFYFPYSREILYIVAICIDQILFSFRLRW